MGVHIDQFWQHRRARKINQLCAFRNFGGEAWRYGRNPITLNENSLIDKRLVGSRVN